VTWLFTLLAIAVIALAAGVITGRIGGGMDAAPTSSPFRDLPPDGVVADDLDALRFTPALRGYRMDEVDRVLDQLSVELRRRDEEIARLQAQVRGEPYPPVDADAADGDVAQGVTHVDADGDSDADGDPAEVSVAPDGDLVADRSADSSRERF
jgi:DivIVA domain-containing protein